MSKILLSKINNLIHNINKVAYTSLEDKMLINKYKKTVSPAKLDIVGQNEIKFSNFNDKDLLASTDSHNNPPQVLIWHPKTGKFLLGQKGDSHKALASILGVPVEEVIRGIYKPVQKYLTTHPFTPPSAAPGKLIEGINELGQILFKSILPKIGFKGSFTPGKAGAISWRPTKEDKPKKLSPEDKKRLYRQLLRKTRSKLEEIKIKIS